uniref:Toxin 26 n=1 Tax=Cupiennius salei TaxID=6928 RepID=A0A4Y5UGP9_CUPSA|nr:toxin 26 precursor [Cupiennius salei]
MKVSTVFGLCIVAFLLLSIVDVSDAEEIDSEKATEERGYCAEKNIKCNDIHCCTGLKCKCNSSRTNCVCRKE